MHYEDFKAALASVGITPDSHAVMTMEKIEASEESGIGYISSGRSDINHLLQFDPRASDQEIKKVEEILQVSLPENYVRFLKDFGGADGLYQQWPEVFSATWEDGECDLLVQQEGYGEGFKGNFVRIGDFDEEQFGFDCGHFGFVVEYGICQPEVGYIDHEYHGDNIDEYFQVVCDDICEFLLWVIDRQYTNFINPDDGDSDNEKDLITAAYNGDLEYVRELLEDGADIEVETEKDETALMQAAWPGHIEVVKLLLERGAKVDAKDEDGDTSLIKAAYHGRLEVVRLLLAHKARVDLQDDAGYTALIVAAWQNHSEVVRLLLEHGAEVNIKNAAGQSALSITENEEIRAGLESSSNRVDRNSKNIKFS